LLEPVLVRSLHELSQLSAQALVEQRYQKFRNMGQFFA
jgi:acetyl-CoA carboxylase alpha subunit